MPGLLRPLAAGIAQLPATEFWLFTGFGALVVGACGVGAYIQLARKRLIENMPTTLLRSAAQGYVELHGRVRLFDGEPIVAPLSGLRCAWYRFRVEHRAKEMGRAGKRRTEWRVIERGLSEALFMLDDGTGRCAVDPEGASVTPSCRQRWYGRSRIAPRPNARAGWIRFLGIDRIGCDYRYTEERIEVGDDLYALGFFRTHGGAATHVEHGHAVADRLRAWKRDRAALIARFDANGDGSIDEHEWQRARSAAADEVAREHAARGAPPAVDVLGATGDPRRPFLLSARTEAELRVHHGRRALVLFLAALLGAMALGLGIMARLG